MLLLHPESALLEEGHTVIIPPRQIDLFNFVPDRAALFCAHSGLFVDAVLKLVHAHKIGNHGKRRGKMRVFCLIHVLLPEEVLEEGIGEVFHGHGVNLVDLARGA
ncbi:hypothetical protein SDC9_158365 [bioreactor metagenome]|uniref:Uncharacterized protein n=1 Tax=bioreactor metagenome TaxID=1076179 RepID=A0A645FEY8_9ZZZZ